MAKRFDHSRNINPGDNSGEYRSSMLQRKWRPELEVKPQAELNDAWKVVLRRNLAKGSALSYSRTAVHVGWTELWAIEQIEKLATELDSESLVGAELRV